jgi:hypothetical protein
MRLLKGLLRQKCNHKINWNAFYDSKQENEFLCQRLNDQNNMHLIFNFFWIN